MSIGSAPHLQRKAIRRPQTPHQNYSTPSPTPSRLRSALSIQRTAATSQCRCPNRRAAKRCGERAPSLVGRGDGDRDAALLVVPPPHRWARRKQRAVAEPPRPRRPQPEAPALRPAPLEPLGIARVRGRGSEQDRRRDAAAVPRRGPHGRPVEAVGPLEKDGLRWRGVVGEQKCA